MRILFTAILVMLAMLPSLARAEHVDLANGGVYYFYQYQRGDSEDFFEKERKSLLEQGYANPDAPRFPPAPDYFQMEKALTVSGRIEAIVHGISIDIPAEYDMYATEIRRFMANVGDPDSLDNIEGIDAQLKNIDTAQLILAEWKKKTMAEIKEIEATLKSDPSSSGFYTSFNANRRIVENFYADAGRWMSSHEKMLNFLKDRQGFYLFYDPIFAFEDEVDVRNFQKLVEHHQILLEKVRTYRALSPMVY